MCMQVGPVSLYFLFLFSFSPTRHPVFSLSLSLLFTHLHADVHTCSFTHSLCASRPSLFLSSYGQTFSFLHLLSSTHSSGHRSFLPAHPHSCTRSPKNCGLSEREVSRVLSGNSCRGALPCTAADGKRHHLPLHLVYKVFRKNLRGWLCRLMSWRLSWCLMPLLHRSPCRRNLLVCEFSLCIPGIDWHPATSASLFV